MQKSSFTTYDMVLSAIGAALIAVSAFVSITVMAVPFTLQTLAIFAVLMSIGGKRGTVSILCYLLLGAVGVPVFSGFKGGISVLLGPTGGFLAGFIFLGLVYWALNDLVLRTDARKTPVRIGLKIAEAVIAEIVMYAFGVVWFMTIYAAQTGPVGIGTALSWCVIPFILPDIIKILAAAAVSEAARKVIKK